ncbi:MAG: lysophospholipid acyltransferase family protein [Planctomycetota bacterium]
MADRPRTDAPALEHVRDFDGVRLEVRGSEWPVEVAPFRDERFRSLWHRLQYHALRASQRGTLLLPRLLQRGITRTVAGTARALDRRHRDAARDFIRTALPDASPEELDRLDRTAWRHLVRVALVSEGVTPRLMGSRLGDHYDVHMAPEVREVLAEDRGALLVTAHCGYWEASCPGVNGVGFRPTYAIGKAPRNDFVAQHIQRMRESQGMRLIARAGAMATVPQAVRAGAHVGMLLDHRPRQKPVFAPFFGRMAGCDRSAGVLIRRVGAPLVFYGCYSSPGGDPLSDWRFELRFPRVIRPEELAGKDPVAIATLVNRELEGLILHRPDEVFWLHDRYRGAEAKAAAAAAGAAGAAAAAAEATVPGSGAQSTPGEGR